MLVFELESFHKPAFDPLDLRLLFNLYKPSHKAIVDSPTSLSLPKQHNFGIVFNHGFYPDEELP